MILRFWPGGPPDTWFPPYFHIPWHEGAKIAMVSGLNERTPNVCARVPLSDGKYGSLHQVWRFVGNSPPEQIVGKRAAGGLL